MLSTAAWLAATGCSVFDAGTQVQHSDARIVEQFPIDRYGAPTAGAPSDIDPAGNGTTVCPPLSIAVAVPLSGPDATLGRGIRNGIQLAVDEHNGANAGCQIQLKPFDTEGDAGAAEQAARQLVDDAFTIGVIGPAGSDEAAVAGPVFDDAGIVAITPSATRPELAARGWRTFLRGLANSAVQGVAVANYLRRTMGSSGVCVLDDGDPAGAEVVRVVRETLGPAADPACSATVGDDPHALDAVIAAEPDAVFFSGGDTQAAVLAGRLRGSGADLQFLTVGGVPEPETSMQAAESVTYREFVAAYTDKFGEPPAAFSATGYDLGAILLNGIDAGAWTRPALLDRVRASTARGLDRTYRWSVNGELVDPPVWVSRLQ
ncbi:branched-chain amino acid ABC transporter substrate-binding protein [Mycobacterium sp. SMC-4]|uniref:branched-chain amino acid ABC transporter substrate-binding protein n=1 Tax=Mycobacterium sp. SMC-4 TaxID=2857059 RepID=UPI0021B23921|nr:branched-chain amino acid ABC transporter substrate-binding protein [Mycobacterium sp. SMC-4]